MQLVVFRPGEERRLLARCQFGAIVGRGAGATLTYPIPNLPWRRNPMHHVTFDLGDELIDQLFESAREIARLHPKECLSTDELWNDASEKANGITRDRATNTLCYSVSIAPPGATPEVQFSLRETSPALLGSLLYNTVAGLISPYERWPVA